MATLKTRNSPHGHITEVAFSPADLRLFALATADHQFAFNMALTIWGVGTVAEQNATRKLYKCRLNKTIRHLAEGLALLRDMPPALQFSVSKSIPLIEATYDQVLAHRDSLFPPRKPVDVRTRRLLHGVAHQLRKRGVPVTVSAEAKPSLLIRIAEVLLKVTGKAVQPDTIKKQATKIGLPLAPEKGVPHSSNLGVDGIALSEGDFDSILDGVKLSICEYTPKIGWRGFQFLQVPFE